MWGPLCLLWMLIWTTSGAPSVSTVCPENCECSISNDGLKAHCSSTEFLSKLRPKQIHEITELDLSGTSLRIIDHKLRKLKNLRKLGLSKNNIEELTNFPYLPRLTHLYLSQNRIKQFTASDLPKSVEHLDLSSNRIANITDTSKLLPHLVEINFNDNILSCECDFLKYRDILHQNNVHIARPASCYTPENVRGISMLSVYCAFGKVAYDNWEDMLGDDPGSGEDIGAIAAASRSSDILDFDKTDGAEEEDGTTYDKIEDEYFQTNVDKSASTTESDEDSYEGSGSALFDVGSGDGEIAPILPDPNVSHCYYNCSTPAPVDEANQSAQPASISQEINRLFKEITGNEESTTTTTSTVAPIKEEEVKSKSVAAVFKGVAKEEPPIEEKESDKTRAAADVPKDLQTTANTSEKDNTTTYVIVGVLFAAMVVLIAYVVVKKRNQRDNNRRPSSNHDVKEPVEMKPLMTDPIATKPITVPERTPLMNGQNGTNKKLDVDEPTNDETDTTDSKAPIENGIDVPEEEEPQIRPKQEGDVLLTPSTKRVTIQAKELSSPKSPVLVHRHLGDDGTIFITPPVSKNEKHT